MDVVAIEDDPGIRWLLGEVLSIAGASHAIVSEPAEALGAVHRHLPAVALVDVDLGRADGVEVARQIMAVAPRTQVVFLTGCGERIRDHCRGALESAIVIHKPFDVGTVIDVVRQCVGQHPG